MKRILLLLILIFSTSYLTARADGNDSFSFPKEILQEESKTGKPILVYCYTSWCKPCGKMSKEVFSDKRVKDYLSENYILYKIDMESEEGIRFSQKYNIANYPTFLTFQKGVMINKFVGAYNSTTFLEKIKRDVKKTK